MSARAHLSSISWSSRHPGVLFRDDEPDSDLVSLRAEVTPDRGSAGIIALTKIYGSAEEAEASPRTPRARSRGAGSGRGPASAVASTATAASTDSLAAEAAEAATAGSPRRTRPRPRSAPPARAATLRGRGLFASTPLSRAPSHQEPPRSFKDKLHLWNLQHQDLDDRQKQARLEKEERELQQCTFQPVVNSKSEFFARRSRGCSLETLTERLHRGADLRVTLRRKCKELMEADALCECTFRPQINAQSARQSGDDPIHVRAELLQRAREKRARVRQSAEEQAQCSFQPKISCKSEKMVQRKQSRIRRSLSQGESGCLKLLGPVEERLYAQAQAAEQRRAALQDGGQAHFSPRIDEGSRRICKSSVYFKGAQQDFVTRQQTFALAKQRRLEVRVHHADSSTCSFRPRILDASREIVASNFDYVFETPDEIINRLACKDVERRERQRSILEQQRYHDCTFKPDVNNFSHVLVSRTEDAVSCTDSSSSGLPVHERLYRSAQNKCKSSDDSTAEECNFKPQVHPNSAKRFAHVKARYTSTGSGIMENIREQLERREELLRERRREMAEEELANCTFAPEPYKPPLEELQRPVSVPGLDRFFQLRSLAQRQQQEMQERQARLFRPETCTKRYSGMTIPEPFDLSFQREASLKARRPSCRPFTPRVSEAATYDIARHMMGSILVC